MRATYNLAIPQLDRFACATYNNNNLLLLDTQPSSQGKQPLGILLRKRKPQRGTCLLDWPNLVLPDATKLLWFVKGTDSSDSIPWVDW